MLETDHRAKYDLAMTYLEILRSNIGAELGRRSYHQKDAAEALAMSKGSFSAKLHGRGSFKVDELVALASWLEIPFSRLVEGFDEAVEITSEDGGTK